MAKTNKGVIWDMDGVLADTGKFHYEAWKKVFGDMGIDFSWGDFIHSFGTRNDRIIPKVLRRKCTKEEIISIDDKKEYLFREFAKGKVKPLDGLVELLISLVKDGFKMAVASSGTTENVEAVIEQCRLKSFFRVIVNGMQVKHGKPHPEVFLLAGEKLGIQPSKCVVVEDAIAGVEGAKKAGMKCIAITSTHKKNVLKKADLIVEKYEQLNPRIFSELIELIP
jgi:beta-phosphoglucomutase family hydrolase